MKICKIEGCSNSGRLTRGMCNSHYKRWLRHGDPLAGGSIQYSTPEEAFEARTEWQGECLIWVGAANNEGYGVLTIKRKSVLTHRYAWERENGPIPEGMLIDHKDHCNTACVNVKHLRLATYAENNANKGALGSDNTSGHRNIYWSKAANKWQVTVKEKYFGVYSDIEEAIAVARIAREQAFGVYAGKG